MPAKKNFCPYTEAQSAAQALGFNSQTEYKKRYREDPRLPASPHEVYANTGWTDWYDFLGKQRPEWYPTYTEAQAAVQALGIKKQLEYQKRCREDPRLSSTPQKLYAKDGWTDWYDFLGKQRPDLYPTYAQAQGAVQALGIKRKPEYNKRYKEDPRLPGAPNLVYANAGWADWYDFLGNQRSDFYPTYAEAQSAVQALGFNSQAEYQKRYREDPRLPARPHTTYANTGWTDSYDFFGKQRPELYPTYAEAQAASLALDIKSEPEYKRRYREDPRLPSNIQQFYTDAGWIDWYDFLGNNRPDLYPTYAEAQAVVQALGIKKQPEYQERYREDPRLPSNPQHFYADADWINWYDFLGNKQPDLYSSYTEAQTAAKTLGIKSMSEYNKRYRQDPKLPACPFQVYDGTGWIDWYGFLGNESPNAALAAYPLIWGDVKQWLKTQTGITSKRASIRAFLGGFCRAQGLPDDSKYLLLRANSFPTEAYQQFIEDQAESLKRPYHSAITTFFGWLLDEYCTDTDADERVVLPEYRNPFATVLAGYAESRGCAEFCVTGDGVTTAAACLRS